MPRAAGSSLVLVAASLHVVLGCNSSNSPRAASDGGPSCGYAAGVVVADAGPMDCLGAAGVALCTYGNLNEECFTDDLTTCPDADAIFEGGPYRCADVCAASEYAVACGYLNPAPPGCHPWDAGEPIPGVACCPCL